MKTSVRFEMTALEECANTDEKRNLRTSRCDKDEGECSLTSSVLLLEVDFTGAVRPGNYPFTCVWQKTQHRSAPTAGVCDTMFLTEKNSATFMEKQSIHMLVHCTTVPVPAGMVQCWSSASVWTKCGPIAESLPITVYYSQCFPRRACEAVLPVFAVLITSLAIPL